MLYGYQKIRVLLNREGWDARKYLGYWLCRCEGKSALKRMEPVGKHKAARTREDRLKSNQPNEAWAWMSACHDGERVAMS